MPHIAVAMILNNHQWPTMTPVVAPNLATHFAVDTVMGH